MLRILDFFFQKFFVPSMAMVLLRQESIADLKITI